MGYERDSQCCIINSEWIKSWIYLSIVRCRGGSHWDDFFFGCLLIL